MSMAQKKDGCVAFIGCVHAGSALDNCFEVRRQKTARSISSAPAASAARTQEVDSTKRKA